MVAAKECVFGLAQLELVQIHSHRGLECRRRNCDLVIPAVVWAPLSERSGYVPPTCHHHSADIPPACHQRPAHAPPTPSTGQR